MSIKDEVKEWVAANVKEWQSERLEWFQMELVPDEYLEQEVLASEGGGK